MLAPPPRLLFTIDVEEDMPRWEIADEISTANVRALPRLAESCARLGVRPTYLCDYPVATIPESRDIVAELAERGECEVGTHMHPWNTPPYSSDAEKKRPGYGHQLAPGQFRAKMESVHAAVAEMAGREPTSFRAGRFGLDAASLAELPELGYLVDTSVTPMVHHREDGGPDFRGAPHVPYRPSAEDICRPGDLPIAEVPVSIGLTRKLGLFWQRAYARIPPATRVRGLLSRDFLGLVDFAWLYPARFELEPMQRVADSLTAAGVPTLNVFLHSSELLPGAAFYGQTEAEIESCFDRIEKLLAYCIETLGAQPATLSELAPELFESLGIERPLASAAP